MYLIIDSKHDRSARRSELGGIFRSAEDGGKGKERVSEEEIGPEIQPLSPRAPRQTVTGDSNLHIDVPTKDEITLSTEKMV